MDTAKKIPENSIFPRGTKISGEQIAHEHFIGSAWLSMLVPDTTTFHCPIGNITFAPGARNSWHTHPGGQILLVTNGRGYSQEEGKPVQIIREGDVVAVPPHVKHWHGATPESWFTHIAIMPNSQKGDATWFTPVSDEEYKNLK